MARNTIQLTDTKIKNALIKPSEYVLCEHNGLRIRIKPNGSKVWIFHYAHPFTKKRTNLSLGSYPALSLKVARQYAADYQELLQQHIDPKAHRDSLADNERALHEHTFFNIAQKWFDLKKHDVTTDYAEDIWRSFKLHIFEQLGTVPVDQITAPMVIQILRPIEAKGSLETIKRLIQRLNEVMNYAVNYGLVTANPLSGIKEVFKKPKKENMAALSPAELPELMSALVNASVKYTTRSLIEWQLHTMTRPSEAAATKWSELDLDAKVWTIPSERMKKRKEHRIPLTQQMLNIVEAMRPISGHREYLFPADRDPRTHSNSQTANMALKRMGFANRLVSHGLRSLASTTLNEQGFDRDLIESALSHVDDNQVRSAYNRTDYLERRRPMMDWWSKHIEQAAQGSLSVTGHRHLKVI